MKISAPQYKGVESLGRNNLSSVNTLANAVSSKGSAARALANQVAKVATEFVQREEKANFNNVLSDTKVEVDGWKEENNVKEFFNGSELQGRIDGVELSKKGTDQYGDEIDIPIKNIPAYKVYPQLLAKKLEGVMNANAKRILNPLDRQAYIESRQVYNADEVRAASLVSARQQYSYQRKENDTKRKQALLNGDSKLADFLAKGYEGTDFEISEKLTQNRQGMEVYEADELIRIEDTKGMTDYLNYLRDPQYTEKGGPLPERKNIDLQNRLKSKIGSMAVRGGAIDKIYKAEMHIKGLDFLAAQDDGALKSAEQVDRMRATLDNVGFSALSIKIRRAEKTAPVIDAMKKLPADQHQSVIDDFAGGKNTKGDESLALKRQMEKQSRQIAQQIKSDTTGFYQREINPPKKRLGEPGYWAESVQAGKQAKNTYKTPSKPLGNAVAERLGKNFEFATTQKKTDFIASVLREVPEKADRDALFTQIDQTKNGNLNVYADMVERGEDETIKGIEEGNKLREDKTLGLAPKDLAANINIELTKVFRLNSELVGYREAVMDYYAKLSNDNNDFNALNKDGKRMKEAIKAVVGNVVEYDGRNFLLPDNTLDAGSFDDWVNQVPMDYLETLGGVIGMDNKRVNDGIRSGDITLWPSLTRGSYLLRDVNGSYLQTKNTENNKPANFTLIYERNATTGDKQRANATRSRGRTDARKANKQ